MQNYYRKYFILKCIILMIFRFSAFAEEEKPNFSIPSVIDVVYPSSFEVQQDYLREAELKNAMPWLVRKSGEAWFPVVDDVQLLVLRHNSEKTTRIVFGVSPPVLPENDFVNASQESIEQLVSTLSEKQASFDKQEEITVLKPQTGRRVTLPSGNTVLFTERTIKKRNGLEKKENKILYFTDRFMGIIDISMFSDSSPKIVSDIEEVINDVRFVSSPNPHRYGVFQNEFMRAASQASNSLVLMMFQFACMFFASIAALIHNIVYLKLHKDTPSFFYGYFIGYYLIFWPVFLALNQLGVASAALGPALGILLVAGIIFSVIGFFCLKRIQVVFYICCFLTFNMLLWLISIAYAFTGAKRVWKKRLIPPPLPNLTEELRFTTHNGNTQFQPMTVTEIKHAVSNGLLSPSHFYWSEKTNEWRSISEIV